MPSPQEQADLQRLQLLREHRVRNTDPASAASLLQREATELPRRERSLGAIADAWTRVVPDVLASQTAIVSISRGVLTVACNATTRYQLDRFLRDGGERELIRLCPVGVRKIRLISGSIGEPPSQRFSDATPS